MTSFEVVTKKLLDKKLNIMAHLMTYKHSYNKINKNLFYHTVSGVFSTKQRLITDSNVIGYAHQFLASAMSYLNLTYPNVISNFKITKYTPRQFLTYILILYHPTETLGKVEDSDVLAKTLILKAKLLNLAIRNVHRKPTNKQILSFFLYQVKQYINAFEKWKNDDAELLVESLIRNYWELELVVRQDFSGQEDGGESIIAMMKQQQEKVLKYIKDISGEAGLMQFENYVPIVMTNDFIDKLKNTLDIAYWDAYRAQMYVKMDNIKGEYNTTKLKSVMTELKGMIVDLVPNSQEIQASLIENFDIDFICEMVSHNSYSIDNLRNMWNYLCDLLNKLDSPDNDNENKELNTEIYKILNELSQREDLPLIKKIGEGWIYIFSNLIPRLQNIDNVKNFIMNQVFNSEDEEIDDDI
jgi:hypothetical protein